MTNKALASSDGAKIPYKLYYSVAGDDTRLLVTSGVQLSMQVAKGDVLARIFGLAISIQKADIQSAASGSYGETITIEMGGV